MHDGAAEPERIDLHVIFSGALDTEELSLEHDTLVVSLELKRRVAEDVRAATEASSTRADRTNGARASRS